MPDTQFFTDHNARHVFHPMGHPAEIQSNPPRIICKGEGVFIEDEQGNRVVDAVGGLWNVNLGYSCEPIKQAIAEQLAELPYYSSFRGTTTPGVIEAALSTTPPIPGMGIKIETPYRGSSGPLVSESDAPRAAFRVVGPGYFNVIGTTLLAGRDFTHRDTEESPSVVIVNEAQLTPCSAAATTSRTAARASSLG